MHLTLYLWILGVGPVIVFVCNVFFGSSGYPVWALALFTWGNSFAIFGMDALIATFIHKLPAEWFDPHKKIFLPYSWERKFYKFIRIIDWKDYIPDTGKLTTGLSKSKISSIKSDYLYHFLIETCYAENLHCWMAVSGIVNMIVNPRCLTIPLILPLALINLGLNIPPVLIQRNNRPKLFHLYEMQIKKQQNSEK
jgi:hypothetical protein